MNPAEYIKANSSILEAVQHYVPLEKKTEKNWVGLCPFHSEKTPSFSVNPSGFYYCFGCGAKGDIFKFVQAVEGIGFTKAARLLVERFQIPAPVKLHNRAVRQKIQELEQAGDREGAKAMIDQLKRRAA